VLPESVEFDIDLRPGSDRQSYLDSLNTALQPLGVSAQPNTGRLSASLLAMEGLIAILSTMLIAVAGLGVLNTVVLDTRERVHDLGIFKALGMSPRQAIAAILTSVTVAGVLGDAVGMPIGAALHHAVLPAMGHAAGARIPSADITVYHLPVLAPLALGGLVIAIARALLPAGWAARTRTAAALRTE
jgi:putative ABC transport system permease protein